MSAGTLTRIYSLAVHDNDVFAFCRQLPWLSIGCYNRVSVVLYVTYPTNCRSSSHGEVEVRLLDLATQQCHKHRK